MVWTIGDEGFEMTLTAEVPRIIGREILDVVTGFLDAAPGDERSRRGVLTGPVPATSTIRP